MIIAFTAGTSESARVQCAACNDQIALIGGDLMVVELGLKKDTDGSIIVKEGKQHITGWSKPRKAKDLNTWWIPSPITQWPEYYEQLVAGFNFVELDAIPEEWLETREEV